MIRKPENEIIGSFADLDNIIKEKKVEDVVIALHSDSRC